MRALLRAVVTSDSRLVVAGTAADGKSALQAMKMLHPDVVILDIDMPIVDGLNTLKEMRAVGQFVPMIICSTLTRYGTRVTIEALAAGAADYVTKPSGHNSAEAAIESLANDLIPKIMTLTNRTRSGSSSHLLTSFCSDVRCASPTTPSSYSSKTFFPEVVVIGVSTGGPAALDVLLPALPENFPLPVLVVQHMPQSFTTLLAGRLNGLCAMRVCEASQGEPIQPGTVYIARGDQHLEIAMNDSNTERRLNQPSSMRSPLYTRLSDDPPENHCRPAVDVLFRSAVAGYGSGVLGVVLTGMGSDGLSGSRLIRENRGVIIVQDEATSTVWGMPGAVNHAGLANHLLPLNAIAYEIIRLAGRTTRKTLGLKKPTV